jgi:hypothetical protein
MFWKCGTVHIFGNDSNKSVFGLEGMLEGTGCVWEWCWEEYLDLRGLKNGREKLHFLNS